MVYGVHAASMPMRRFTNSSSARHWQGLLGRHPRMTIRSCRKAIVASAVGEAVHFLDGGRVGRLVRPGSAGALADGILELLADANLRATLGAEARDHLRRNHTGSLAGHE